MFVLGAAAAALFLLPESPWSHIGESQRDQPHRPRPAPAPAPPPAPERPNLIMMLVDGKLFVRFAPFFQKDLGYADMEWTTTDLNGTAPTLAGLAADGTILTNVYAQYQCSPTRA